MPEETDWTLANGLWCDPGRLRREVCSWPNVDDRLGCSACKFASVHGCLVGESAMGGHAH